MLLWAWCASVSWVPASSSFQDTPGVRLLGHMVILCLIFQGSTTLLSVAAAPSCTRTPACGAPASHILPGTRCSGLAVVLSVFSRARWPCVCRCWRRVFRSSAHFFKTRCFYCRLLGVLDVLWMLTLFRHAICDTLSVVQAAFSLLSPVTHRSFSV